MSRLTLPPICQDKDFEPFQYIMLPAKIITYKYHQNTLVVYSCIYFTWPLRKQAAYKQVTRGPTALSHFRGTIYAMRIKCLAKGHYILPLPADSNRGPHD